MKVYEGAILTCDANDQVARYLVEDDGRILYVGDELPERYISVRHEAAWKESIDSGLHGQPYSLCEFFHISCRIECHECCQ